jgi:hypothetical protein
MTQKKKNNLKTWLLLMKQKKKSQAGVMDAGDTVVVIELGDIDADVDLGPLFLAIGMDTGITDTMEETQSKKRFPLPSMQSSLWNILARLLRSRLPLPNYLWHSISLFKQMRITKRSLKIKSFLYWL